MHSSEVRQKGLCILITIMGRANIVMTSVLQAIKRIFQQVMGNTLNKASQKLECFGPSMSLKYVSKQKRSLD